MRQVIDGKVYDTETATFLHHWDNGHNYGDFKYRSKKLFRTRKGAFFLHHDGGAMTDMAQNAGGENNYAGSEALEPISRKTAIRFLESHDGAEVLIREFADDLEEA